jgi:hypothetical protein
MMKNAYQEQVCLNDTKCSKKGLESEEKLQVKTMLTAFFDARGIIHHEFVLEKRTLNGFIKR